jgi:hypothetical protein
MPGPVGAVLGRAASRLAPLPPAQAADLLVHCAQEMSHLATILPDLHAAFSTGPSA